MIKEIIRILILSYSYGSINNNDLTQNSNGGNDNNDLTQWSYDSSKNNDISQNSDKDNNKDISFTVEATKSSRKENKRLVCDAVRKNLLELLK